jgi:DNA-binding response OmpR family regulator
LLPAAAFTKLQEGLGAPFTRLLTHPKESSAAMALEQAVENTTEAVKRRILLVDDDAEIIDAMRFALESKGYQILVARDGNQGLAMAEVENPDLIILDMMMPKRSGFLVLEKLRLALKSDVKVIMVTANEGTRHRDYAVDQLRVDDYLRKPFAMDKLLDAVQRQIG